MTMEISTFVHNGGGFSGFGIPRIWQSRPFSIQQQQSTSNFHELLLGRRCFGATSSPTLCKAAILIGALETDSAISNAFDPTAGASATTTFDPILNIPALVTFLFIMSVFSALIVRTNQVENAVQERKQTLQALRALKSKELDGDFTVTTSHIEDMLYQYEQSVRQEESLRNILPGGLVRIIPPSAGDDAEEEARIVAKQFLGQDFDIGADKRQRNESGKLPTTAIGILTVLMLSLVSLLAFLTVNDPMGATTITSSLLGLENQ